MKRLICLFITLVYLFAFAPMAYAVKENKTHAEPQIRADAAILIDYDTGQVYYEKRGWDLMHPASTTKILTAILALESGELSDTVTISREAGVVDRGSSLRLRAGDKLTLDNLIKGALLLSANDSTVAIAQHMAGDADLYVRLMNAKAVALGALQSGYVNTNGFTKPNHLTTAFDLALMTRYALHNKDFARIVRTKRASIQWTEPDKTMAVNNTNKLLWTYQGAMGVKTGTTSAAGGCLVAAAKRGERTLISVVLRSSRRYEDSTKILDYGFDEVKDFEFITKGEAYGKIKVADGITDYVGAVASKSFKLTLPQNTAKEYRTLIYLPQQVTAPITAGTSLGTITVLHKGCKVIRIPLVAGYDVEKESFFHKLFK